MKTIVALASLILLTAACNNADTPDKEYMIASVYSPTIYVNDSDTSSEIEIYNAEHNKIKISRTSSDIFSFAPLPPLVSEMKYHDDEPIAFGKTKVYIHNDTGSLDLDVTFCYTWNPEMAGLYGGDKLFVEKIESEGRIVTRDPETDKIVITLVQDIDGLHLE